MTSTKRVLEVETRVPEISDLKGLGTWFPGYKQLMIAFYEMLNGVGAPYELRWEIIDVPSWLKSSQLSEMHESLQFPDTYQVALLLNGPMSGHQQNVGLRGKVTAAVHIEDHSLRPAPLLSGLDAEGRISLVRSRPLLRCRWRRHEDD